MPQGLAINATEIRGAKLRPPTKPTFFAEGPGRPHTFASVAELARFLHRLRRRRGLQLTPRTATWCGSDVFPVIEIDLLTEGDDQSEFVGAAAIQGMRREAFQEVLAEAAPREADRELPDLVLSCH
jgi:hypothetical protein